MSKEVILLIILGVGVMGTLLPFLPGAVLMFLAVLIYGFIDNWMHFSPLFVVNIGIITVAAIALDYFSGIIGAKKFGASKNGTWGGVLGGIFGVFLLGPLGLIAGVISGVIIGELFSGKSFNLALKSLLGTVIGIVGGAIFQFILALVIFIWVYTKVY